MDTVLFLGTRLKHDFSWRIEQIAQQQLYLPLGLVVSRLHARRPLSQALTVFYLQILLFRATQVSQSASGWAKKLPTDVLLSQCPPCSSGLPRTLQIILP